MPRKLDSGAQIGLATSGVKFEEFPAQKCKHVFFRPRSANNFSAPEVRTILFRPRSVNIFPHGPYAAVMATGHGKTCPAQKLSVSDWEKHAQGKSYPSRISVPSRGFCLLGKHDLAKGVVFGSAFLAGALVFSTKPAEKRGVRGRRS